MPKICVVGGGRWGQNHIKTLKSIGCEVDVVDPVVEAKYSCVGEVDLESYDGFTVASPAITHFEIGRHILEGGKPALIEKPAALSFDEARKLVQTDQTVMVGHLFLFHPAIRKIKEMLPDLGEIRFIHSNRLNFGNIRTEEDVIWGSMPHDVSIINYLMDEEEPESVSCDKRAFLKEEVADGAIALLQYEKTMATIHVNWLWPTKDVNLTVVCSEGTLTFDLNELALYRNSVSFGRNGAPTLCRGEKEVISYPNVPPLEAELRYFLGHLDRPAAVAGKDNLLRVSMLLESFSHD
jgi:UDP-2-acetamido-3-amino-2,3-dideoxy-glucuronate N-acetyltransferase